MILKVSDFREIEPKQSGRSEEEQAEKNRNTGVEETA